MNNKLCICLPFLMLLLFVTISSGYEIRNTELNQCLATGHMDLNSSSDYYDSYSRTIWDILFSFETTSSTQTGIATDGSFIYTSSFSTPFFRKFEMDGTFVEEFLIDGVSAANCMTYDGTYFYGAKGNLSDGIFVLDLENHLLVNTISISAPSIVAIGHISYDPSLDSGNGGFWVGYWVELAAVDMSGNEIIENISGNSGCAGTAYDGTTDPNNPCLYLFQQAGTTNLEIHKFDIKTQVYSGPLHVATDINAPTTSNKVASGMNSFVNTNGKYVLMGLIDRFPEDEVVFGYEISSITYGVDIGVQRLLSPVTGDDLTAAENVTVEVLNNGTAPISSFQLQYTIDDGTGPSGPFTQTVTQGINSGETINFTFSQKADLSASETAYTIVVTVSLPGDENAGNDILSKVVTNTSGTYGAGGGGGPEHISNVQIAGISNPSGCDYYADYSGVASLHVLLEIGVPETLLISIGGGYNADIGAVWIDWNRDFDFSSDERVFLSGFGPGPYNTSITAPDSSVTGEFLRMRLRLDYNEPNPEPYGTTSFGEVEDYTVIVGSQGIVSNSSAMESRGTGFLIVSPNPTHGTASIEFGAPEEQPVKINIYDLNGRIIESVYDGDVPEQNILEMHLNNLPAGIYIMKLESSSFQISKRFMVIN